MRVCALLILSLASALSAAGSEERDRDASGDEAGNSGTVWATPHDSYSSSVGVLGCKIDTDRVAYWPGSVDCDNICVSLSYEGRNVKLLRIDQSQGAHDVSYDAWNYLYTGHSATDKPTAGGAVEMQSKNVKASECAHLIHTDGNKLPLSAPNSMNFLASCNDSWVADNSALFNIADSICSLGYDEQCQLDLSESNQPSCPHTLGATPPLKDMPVYNVLYPSGDKVLASSGEVTDVADDGDSGAPIRHPNMTPWMLALGVMMLIVC